MLDSTKDLEFDKNTNYEKDVNQRQISQNWAQDINLLKLKESESNQQALAEILENYEFSVALLGGPSVGKTSLLRKIKNNYIEDSEDNGFREISQEMLKHNLTTK